MTQLIDWHSHHTPPEIVEEISLLTGQKPHMDVFDSTDFSQRVQAMDAAGIDLQLICQGAGVFADRFPAAKAMDLVRKTNDLLAQRIEPYRDRLIGVAAVSLKNIKASAKEIERLVPKGFRVVLLYPRANGEVLLDTPEADPLWAKIAALGLPVFLHGAGVSKDSSLDHLEDRGAGVIYGVISDAQVCECVVRLIAAGLFDRHPNLKIVVRTGGGGLPLLLHRLFWKHKGPEGEKRYSEILLENFLIDTAGVDPRTLPFLLDTMGEERIVFGSDYCGGLGPLEKALTVIREQPDPERIRSITERNSKKLLNL